jgi:hypothetical protein
LQKSNGGLPSVNLAVPICYALAPRHHGSARLRSDVDLPVALLQKTDVSTVARVRDFTPQVQGSHP